MVDSAAPELDAFGNEIVPFLTRRIHVDNTRFLDWSSVGRSNPQSI